MAVRTVPAVRGTGTGARRAPTRLAAARLPFYALMFFTFVVLVAPQIQFPVLAPLHLAFVSAALAAAAHVADRISRAKPLTIMEPEIVLTLLFFGFGALSVPTSYWPGGSVQTLVARLGRSLILFLLLANVLVSAARLRAMLWLLALCSAVPARAVILEYLEGDLLLGRVRGYLSVLTSNPNDVALTLNIIIPLAVGLALACRRPGPRVVLAAVVALGAAGVVVTFSRAGFIFLTITLILYLAQLKQGRIGILLLVLLLMVLMLNVNGFIERIQTIGDVETESSAHARWETTKAAIQLVVEHPLLGVGIGQNVIALNETGAPRWSLIHNVYLQIAVDLGIPALVVYLLLFGRALRSVAEAKRVWLRRGEELQYLAQGLQISLIGFAVAALFYPVAYHFFFYYLLGLAVAVKRLSRLEPQERPR